MLKKDIGSIKSDELQTATTEKLEESYLPTYLTHISMLKFQIKMKNIKRKNVI